MSAHELGHGMHHYVGAVFDRPQQVGRSDRVVDDQRHTMLVCDLGQPFDVRDIARRVTDALAVDGPGVFVDELIYVLGAIARREARGDSTLREDVREQSVGSTVELRQGNYVIARLGDIDERSQPFLS